MKLIENLAPMENDDTPETFFPLSTAIENVMTHLKIPRHEGRAANDNDPNSRSDTKRNRNSDPDFAGKLPNSRKDFRAQR